MKANPRTTVAPLVRRWTLSLLGLLPILAITPSWRGGSHAAEPIITYSAPQGERASNDYKVEVAGQPVFVYTAPVLRGGPVSFTYFDISKPVTVTDIIHDWSQGGGCASLAVLVSDSGTMSDIRFEDIRCEDVRGTLVNCWIGADMWGHDKDRGHIKGATFKDIQVTGQVFPVSKLTGFDDAHLIENVTFERLKIHGKLIGDASAAKLQTNAHVHGVKFLPASERPQGSTDAEP